MTVHLYTIVCEFRGGTYVSQVSASDAEGAVRAWTDEIRIEKPMPRSSASVARNVLHTLADRPPTPLDTVVGVWCVSATCGGDLILANVIQSG